MKYTDEFIEDLLSWAEVVVIPPEKKLFYGDIEISLEGFDSLVEVLSRAVYDPEMEDQRESVILLLSELRKVLDNGNA